MDDKVYFKTLVYLPDFRVAINLRGINRIEKFERLNEHVMTYQYGIAINRSADNGKEVQSDECLYDSEKMRDERFEKLLVEIEALGINVIEV